MLWLLFLAFGAACEAPALAPPAKPKKDTVAPRVRLVVPAGWEQALFWLVQESVPSAQRELAARHFEASHVIEVSWTPAVEAALHGMRDVISVQPVRLNKSWGARPNATHNRNAADTSNINDLLPGGSTGFDLTGDGFSLGEWDEGAPRSSHRELAGRVHVIDGAGPIAHSTQVAGTMIATGVSAAARGMASDAHVLAHDWDVDTLELYDTGTRVVASNHSYGAILGWDVGNCDLPSWLGEMTEEDPAYGKYMADASALDAVAHARDLIVVWAAGNEREDAGPGPGEPHYHWPSCSRIYTDDHVSEADIQLDTLGGQPTLKNGIVVGAVRDVVVDPIVTAAVVSESYSSYGPMDDGRIKPDLVASGDGLFTSDADADDAYATTHGTSLATPVVSGAVALLGQKYRQTHAGRDPRAAEMKALLLHTAREAGDTPGPDYAHGHGLLDALAAAELIDADGARAGSSQQLRSAVVEDGASQTFLSDEVVTAGTPLRVTLAWHDPAGAPNVGGVDDPTPALVNDLDVVLIAPDQQTEFHPWRLSTRSPSAAASRAAPNRVDNVEVIDVDADDNVWSGTWSVRVTVHGSLSPRGRAQAFGLASSVPLSLPSTPVLGAPRVVVVEVPVGGTPNNVTLPITNVGSGTLTWAVQEIVPWLAPDASVGNAPGNLELTFDVSDLSGAGEHVGWIEIDSNDPSGPHRVAVVLRFTCMPDCTGRVCGVDPVCGQECGRCANSRACNDSGSCVPLITGCPAADLGSQLGVVAQGSTLNRAMSFGGTCGGASASDVTYRWTAPRSGTYEITTLGSGFDTVLYLRDGDCNGTQIACNDDSGGIASTVAAWLNADQTVYVTVDGYSDAGPYVLTISEAQCPSADLGSAVGGVVLESSTLGAVNNLSGSCGGATGEDLAMRWAAPAAGEYRFSTLGSEDGRDTVLYVLDGDCGGVELECDDNPNLGNAHAADEVTVSLFAGQVVVVVIDAGTAADVGDVKLLIESTSDSCDGVCGGAPNGSCFCDASCVALGDCCADACSTCGQCACTAACSGAECGDDGCGGSCGQCDVGQRCASGVCEIDPCAGVTCGACEACIEGTCAALPELAACDDGVRCTVSDRCSAGTCDGVPIECDDSDICTVDSCDESDGLCAFARMDQCCADASECGDGNACTTDTCDVPNRRCEHTPRVDCCQSSAACDDNDPCTRDACLLGECFWTLRETCGEQDAGVTDDDASVADDAGWANAQVSGGGCACSATHGTATSSHPAWAGLGALAVAVWWRRRRVRA